MEAHLSDRIRKYLEAASRATAGPWDGSSRTVHSSQGVICDADDANWSGLGYDAAFITASRTEGPAFARALEAVLALCDQEPTAIPGTVAFRDRVRTAIESALQEIEHGE